MTPAYEEMYLNDAMRVMGEMLDYAVHDCGCDGDLFFTQFLASGVAEQFERGNPKFVGGMSGVELALEVFRRTTGQIPDVDASAYGEKSPEYWAGWSLAYYQWESGMPFREIVSHGLTVSEVCSMYLQHEADIGKFAEAEEERRCLLLMHRKKQMTSGAASLRRFGAFGLRLKRNKRCWHI